jgi:predicted ATPase
MTSLIRSISLRNFKGFSDQVRIELRPITLLFGANSAGKSSVLQALQYMREVLERQNVNADRTMQGGEAIDLGGFMNLVHGRDPKSQIEIEVEMSLGEESIPELVPEPFDDWQTQDSDVWAFYNTLQEIRRRVEVVSVRLIVAWSEVREAPVVVGYQIGTNGEWCVKFESTADGRDTRMRINRENPIFMIEREPEDSIDLDTLDDWVRVSDFQNTGDVDQIERPTNKEGKRLTSVVGDLFFAVMEAGLERPGDGLRSWLTQLNGALPRLDQMLTIPAPGAQGAENVYVAREFTAFMSWLTVGPAVLLRDQLRKMRYIGPLRRIPPRGFEVSLTKSESAWSDGMAAWETLVTGGQSLVGRVSDWMQSSTKLGTGYAVARKSYQECDPNSPMSQPTGPIRKRVQLVNGSGLTLHAQDVGVGISQVLPVVVAAQDSSASLVCIEQPELHIHPAVQVGLGDLFIDGALNQGLSFLIETHSEHLVMRLQRRLREHVLGELPEGLTAVDPKDVNFIYLGLDEQGSVMVSQIGLTPEGKFDSPWPNGFFSERAAEVLPSAMRERLEASRRGSPR